MSPERRALVLARGRAAAEAPSIRVSDTHALDLSSAYGSGRTIADARLWDVATARYSQGYRGHRARPLSAREQRRLLGRP